MRLLLCVAAVLAPLVGASAVDQNPAPLVRAHAHNDYRHDRPLLDALDHGFCSIEVDVFAVDGKLLVAHDREDVVPEKTIEALYLEPLWERYQRNGGRIYPNGPEVILLVDFKSPGEETYPVLRDALMQYAPMITTFTPQGRVQGAVTVIVSGSRPTEMIAAEQERYVAVDGRLSDLESNPSRHLMPLVSQSWMSTFKWRGQGEMPKDERARLKEICDTAHAQGRIVRFWAVPHRESLWRVMLEAGVDLINADDLGRLQNFLFDEARAVAGN